MPALGLTLGAGADGTPEKPVRPPEKPDGWLLTEGAKDAPYRSLPYAFDLSNEGTLGFPLKPVRPPLKPSAGVWFVVDMMFPVSIPKPVLGVAAGKARVV